MLWTVCILLLLLWAFGFLGSFGGGLIHMLLVIALVVFLFSVLTGRRD